MTSKEFWGNTSNCNIYETQVLLGIIHEFFVIDEDSRAFQLIHEIFMQGCPFEDPFLADNPDTDNE